MITRAVRAASAFGIAAALWSAPATAGDCWSTDAAAAATVRDLQSLLMVAALQCRGTSTDVLAPYNAFVNARRLEIQTINDRLKAHFSLAAGVAGAAEAQARYDRFTTSLANAYGDKAADETACAKLATLARVAEAVGSIEGLVALGSLQGLKPGLPVQDCANSAVAVATAPGGLPTASLVLPRPIATVVLRYGSPAGTVASTPAPVIAQAPAGTAIVPAVAPAPQAPLAAPALIPASTPAAPGAPAPAAALIPAVAAQ
jgi:hypothetical protein